MMSEEDQVEISSNNEEEIYIKNPARKSQKIPNNEPFYRQLKDSEGQFIEPVKISFEKDSLSNITKQVLKNKEMYDKDPVGKKIIENYQSLPSVGEEASWLTPELYNAPIKLDEVPVELEKTNKEVVGNVSSDEFSLFDVKYEEYFLFFKDEVISFGNSDLIKEKIADLYTVNGEDFDVSEVALFKRIKPRVGILLDE